MRLNLQRKRITFILLAVLFCLVSLFIFDIKFKKCRNINCISFKNSDEYQLRETYQDDDIYKALYSKGSELLRINTTSEISEESANKLINAKVIQIQNSFDKSSSPYPGEVSNLIVCDESFKPLYKEEVINHLKQYYFLGYANDRLTFSACSEDSVLYINTLTLFYCTPSKTLFQIEIFTPKVKGTHQDLMDIIKSISCIK